MDTRNSMSWPALVRNVNQWPPFLYVRYEGDHSYRNATVGSIIAARRAGM